MSKIDEEYIKVKYSDSDKECDITQSEIDDFLCNWIEMVIKKYGSNHKRGDVE
ncbi:hypothetical protein [Paenibacillus glacialis]|uniref:hypothetical protein n=1 Tax=Paenibacillus glacialis TaxID=494026 RepID=UPI000AE1DD40|nr:hypothetical protein [Paenibacillus glacialis]